MMVIEYCAFSAQLLHTICINTIFGILFCALLTPLNKYSWHLLSLTPITSRKSPELGV